MDAQPVALPLPGFRLWGIYIEVRVRGIWLCSKFICVLEEALRFPAGSLLVVIRHVVLRWEELAAIPGLPPSRLLHGQRARDLARDQILADNVRPGLAEDGRNRVDPR
jgi:hypothetical protein